MLTSEGLTAFANASYGWGRPGTTELQLLEYKTKSFYAETGLSYPIIRARERNLIVSALWFWTDDRSSFFDMPETPPSTLDKMRGFRIKFDADFGRPDERDQSAQFRLQPRLPWAGQHRQRRRAGIADQRPDRFQ